MGRGILPLELPSASWPLKTLNRSNRSRLMVRRRSVRCNFWHGRHLGVETLESRVLLSVSQPGTLNRPADPVVLTGANVPALNGIDPADLVAFRDRGTGWEQVPVQVDERAMVTMYQIYGQTISHANQTILTYTDPNTFVGADPDATLDANDEIVFMAKDTGGRATINQLAPADVDPASRLEIRVTDPVNAGQMGWVYLFRRTSNAISPGAGVSYVNYQFNLLVGNGDYKTNYDTLSGPNPENSTIDTAYYSRRFTERWVTDQLNIKAGTDVDLLDRHKFQFAPGYGGRTEDTFSAAEGAFIVNKSGPVRALRSWVGANSGPYTQREEVFYEQREDVFTYLRVHAIPAGMDLFDYNANADGMHYYNNLNLDGVLVDGQPDEVTSGAIQWELLTGSQGSLTHSHILNTNLPGITLSSYYLDDTTPPASDVQVSGDSQAWGQSGPWLQDLASTDTGSAYFMTSQRAMYYGAPGATVADAQRDDSLARNPLQAAVDATAPLSSTVGGRSIFYNQSVWDGNSAAIDVVNDSAAIAPKTPYLPGSGVATAASVTNFSRGITGIMVDLNAGINHTGITASDFTFKVGNNNAPSTWGAAPAPSAIAVFPGAGVGGWDRVIITWASGSIKNQWLEVQVKATVNTGLVTPDIYFWGNKVGDSASSSPATQFSTDASDAAQVFASIGTPKPISDLRDYNRSGSVDATDAAIVFANIGSIVRINIGAGGPFAPKADPAVIIDDGGLAVALALVAKLEPGLPPRSSSSTIRHSEPHGGAAGYRIDEYFRQLIIGERPRVRQGNGGRDSFQEGFELGDELLKNLSGVD
jgi:hypothetical protein